MHVVSFTEIVNGDYVGMPQHRRRAGFSPETGERRVVFNELAGKNLYGHIVADVYATCAIDHAHAALAKLGNEFILAVNLVPDEWIGIGEPDRGKGGDEVVFVIRVRAGAGQC